jgi:hypothetical protein
MQQASNNAPMARPRAMEKRQAAIVLMFIFCRAALAGPHNGTTATGRNYFFCLG